MREFRATDLYAPTGDQPRAIEEIADWSRGQPFQTLLGATGTGKTATMAWAIEKIQRPALVIAHNKTLAAQLCNEFRSSSGERRRVLRLLLRLLPAQAYIPQADLYIEKDSSQNDDIARLRPSAASSLMTRRDVVVVASVSCIYGLGSPEEWRERVLILDVGEKQDRDDVLRKLIESQYVRNDTILRAALPAEGRHVEFQPANQEKAYRVCFFGDEVEQITHFDPLTGEVYAKLQQPRDLAGDGVRNLAADDRARDRPDPRGARERCEFEAEDRCSRRIHPPADRYDLEMLKEWLQKRIENYSCLLEGRPVGSHPFTLIDYFPDDFVVFVDSRIRRCLSSADVRGRPLAQADAGRLRLCLPSALDNRPLRFDEFLRKVSSSSSCRRLPARSSSPARRSSPSS